MVNGTLVMVKNMTIVELCGIAAIIFMLVALWSRPAGFFAILLALAVVGSAVLVSWHDVLQYREQQANITAFNERNASPAVTVPPPNLPHAGS
jgi:hypothetical protein